MRTFKLPIALALAFALTLGGSLHLSAEAAKLPKWPATPSKVVEASQGDAFGNQTAFQVAGTVFKSAEDKLFDVAIRYAEAPSWIDGSTKESRSAWVAKNPTEFAKRLATAKNYMDAATTAAAYSLAAKVENAYDPTDDAFKPAYRMGAVVANAVAADIYEQAVADAQKGGKKAHPTLIDGSKEARGVYENSSQMTGTSAPYAGAAGDEAYAKAFTFLYNLGYDDMYKRGLNFAKRARKK